MNMFNFLKLQLNLGGPAWVSLRDFVKFDTLIVSYAGGLLFTAEEGHLTSQYRLIASKQAVKLKNRS